MPLQTAASLPAGSVTQFAGANAPAGWLLMYGQAVSRTEYEGLFLAIGTTYGAGDGSTTFNLPDARGRALIGKDDMGGSAANRVTSGGSGINGALLGAVGGSEIVTLSEAQIASHSHSLKMDGGIFQGGSSATAAAHISAGTLFGNRIATAGSNNSHNNLPPALIVNYIIKT